MGDIFSAIFQASETIIVFSAFIMSIASIVVAILALKTQRAHNLKSVMPYGVIDYKDVKKEVCVSLKNGGLGPLIVVSCQVEYNSKQEPNLYNLLKPIPERIMRSYTFCPEAQAISPGKEINLFRIYTKKDKITPKFKDYRDKVRNLLKDVFITLNYKDIYGNMFPPVKRKLDRFGRPLVEEDTTEQK